MFRLLRREGGGGRLLHMLKRFGLLAFSLYMDSSTQITGIMWLTSIFSEKD